MPRRRCHGARRQLGRGRGRRVTAVAASERATAGCCASSRAGERWRGSADGRAFHDPVGRRGLRRRFSYASRIPPTSPRSPAAATTSSADLALRVVQQRPRLAPLREPRGVSRCSGPPAARGAVPALVVRGPGRVGPVALGVHGGVRLGVLGDLQHDAADLDAPVLQGAVPTDAAARPAPLRSAGARRAHPPCRPAMPAPMARTCAHQVTATARGTQKARLPGSPTEEGGTRPPGDRRLSRCRRRPPGGVAGGRRGVGVRVCGGRRGAARALSPAPSRSPRGRGPGPARGACRPL